MPDEFSNTQEHLTREAPRVRQERSQAGLAGLVGGLAAVIISTETDRQRACVEEFVRYTGFGLDHVFQGPNYITAVLRGQRGADILVRSRRSGVTNPFGAMNRAHPKSLSLPNTRLETFVFDTPDIERYVAIQRSRGVRFVTDEVIRTDTYWFIQAAPSPVTGASYGFIQWLGGRKRYYEFGDAEYLDWDIPKPDLPHLKNIGMIDHVACRLHARDRDEAILEFMRMTNYNYDFSIYVESLNSITNVARGGGEDAAMVFTTGIRPFIDESASGPTEKFVHNYGPRTHHIALYTQDIAATFAALKADGREFMIELVGGPDEGLHQTFTEPSPSTMIVTEYIHRYGGFTGFFTKSNVTLLTAATAKQ